MSKRLLKTCALALTIGAASTAPAYADYVDAILPNGNHAPCGLYVPSQAGSPGQILTYTWTIGNCHTYAVNRREVYWDNSKGSCKSFPAHRAYQYSTRGTWPKTIEPC